MCKGYTQGGSNADNVMADAFLKINDTSIDWTMAYEAVVKDAEVEPYGLLTPFPISHYECSLFFRLVL